MKKIIASLLIITIVHSISFAQNVRPAALGVSFIVNDFKTPQRIRTTSISQVLKNKQVAKFKENSPGLAFTYFKGLQKHIDFAGTAAGSFVNFPIDDKTFSGDAFLAEGDASVNLKMFSDDYWVTPYLNVGVGVSHYRGYTGAFLPLGGGFKLNLYDEAAVFINAQYRVPVSNQSSTYHLMYSFGIAGTIGKKKTPPVVVAPPPPPADTDHDGITDDVDKCPTVAGLAKYGGCPVPDSDKDGINDEQDKCPTVPGVAKYNGCPVPDTDKDGINDEEDKCPTVPGVARYQGCPVPDSDGDGVNDEEDKCPNLAGTAANNGCPEIKTEVVNKINYAAKNIFFITGSAKLSSKSNKALNDVVAILKSDANLKMSVEGHTDNTGKADKNQTLSEARANSVKAYLVAKGISEDRLSTVGFGQDQPIADNKTAAGRAKNRRVEIKANY